jgi:hypothetical protein
MTEILGYISKTGHGTYFRETITDELAALEQGGRKMWTPLVSAYRGPMPDCRTCNHYAANAQLACGVCTNGDRYDPLPPVRLWRAIP